MGLSPQLEAQLQNARLGLFVSVLLDLGVEYCEDLKFMKEGDIGGRKDISLIQKRRFLEWRDSMLQTGGDTSSDAESQSEHEPRPSALLDLTQDGGSMRSAGKARLEASPMTPTTLSRTQSSIDHSTAASTNMRSSDNDARGLPMQTPRTRAMPFVDVLRELENLDIALKEERERSSNLVEEKQVLEENHARDMKMLECMLQHAYVEIEQLKSTIAAWEHSKTNSSEKSTSWASLENLVGQPSSPERDERVTFAPRESVIEDEPDGEPMMEPRRPACLPNLALPHLELPSFGPGYP